MNLVIDLLAHEMAVRPRRRRFHTARVLFVLGGVVVLLASFWVWRDADGPDASPVFWLACSRRLVATVAKRLAMFVLRAKVDVRVAADLRAVGSRADRPPLPAAATEAATAWFDYGPGRKVLAVPEGVLHEVLDAPAVVIVSTVIPLSLSLGLVWQHLPTWRTPYLVFAVLGFLAIVGTRAVRMQSKAPTLVLALVHGVAGMTIFLLPVILAMQGKVQPLFALVGVGGALIGIGGLLLSFLKAGKPILSREMILKVLPGLLLLMTACFVVGFSYS